MDELACDHVELAQVRARVRVPQSVNALGKRRAFGPLADLGHAAIGHDLDDRPIADQVRPNSWIRIEQPQLGSLGLQPQRHGSRTGGSEAEGEGQEPEPRVHAVR